MNLIIFNIYLVGGFGTTETKTRIEQRTEIWRRENDQIGNDSSV